MQVEFVRWRSAIGQTKEKAALCRPNTRMPEVVALPQHRLPLVPRQGIAEAVPEVQPRRVPAALSEIPISLARDLGLPGNARLYAIFVPSREAE